MFDQWLVVLSGPELVEDVRKLPDDVASPGEGVLFVSHLAGQLSIVVTSFACTAYSGREVYAPGGLDGPLSCGPHTQHPTASIRRFVACDSR